MYDEVSTTFQTTLAVEKYLPVSFSGYAVTDIYSGYSEDNPVTASGIIEERFFSLCSLPTPGNAPGDAISGLSGRLRMSSGRCTGP